MSSPLHLGHLVSSYARVYGEPLREVLLPAYARAVETLFDGEHERSDVRAGRDARAVDVGDSEEGSVLAAAPVVRDWFDGRAGPERSAR